MRQKRFLSLFFHDTIKGTLRFCGESLFHCTARVRLFAQLGQHLGKLREAVDGGHALHLAKAVGGVAEGNTRFL